MFTMEGTSLEWIQFYYQWLWDANACSIMMVHNEYQLDRMHEGSATSSMHCVLVPDAHQIFQDNSDALALSTSLLSSLKAPLGVISRPLILPNSRSRFLPVDGGQPLPVGRQRSQDSLLGSKCLRWVFTTQTRKKGDADFFF